MAIKEYTRLFREGVAKTVGLWRNMEKGAKIPYHNNPFLLTNPFVLLTLNGLRGNL